MKTGERMEEGDEKRVVGIRDGVETHFIVELSSGEVLHCTLPQLYSHRAGIGFVRDYPGTPPTCHTGPMPSHYS